MQIAIFDLGTNSIRFDVYKTPLSANAKASVSKRAMVKLGDKLYPSLLLNEEAEERTIQAIKEYVEEAQSLQIQIIKAVATSAVREAKNGAAFIEKVKKETGLSLRILSGAEEAKLIAKGILSFERHLPKQCLLVDIGGGSTELSLIENDEIVASESFSIGAQRALQEFLISSPPKEESIEKLEKHIKETLKSSPHFAHTKTLTIVGSSGTARTLGKILNVDKREHEIFSKAEISKFLEQTKRLSLDELKKIQGLEEGRAPLIYGGACILYQIILHAEVENVIVSHFSLRHGLLAEALLEMQ